MYLCLLVCVFVELCLSVVLCYAPVQLGPDGIDLTFRPKMKEMEQWDLPTNLALPHLAENIVWSEANATEVRVPCVRRCVATSPR